MGLEKRTYIDQETVITAENLNAIQDSVIALEDGVFMRAANGEAITIADSSNNKLLGLNIYGKSTQASTPTPTAPSSISSAGGNGNIYCGVYGKNIFDANKLELGSNTALTILDDGYTIIAKGGKGVSYANSKYALPLSLKGKSLYFAVDSIATAQDQIGAAQVAVVTPSATYYHPISVGLSTKTFTVPSDATRIEVAVYANSATTLAVDNTVTVKGLRLVLMADKANGWTKAYNEQAITLSRTLRAVPVTDISYANYTDASGKMWCADEIDLARGVYIQRVKATPMTSSANYTQPTSWGNKTAFTVAGALADAVQVSGLTGMANLLSTHFVVSSPANITGEVVNAIGQGNGGDLFLSVNGITSVTALKEWISQNAPTVQYALAIPIETALTAQEIAAYKSLHSNKPNTVVINSATTNMSVRYIADTKAYIDSKLSNASVKANVALPASAWIGSGNIYSQVVRVEGVTKNSQVNLTPSISQMATFYEKDITFLTENDGGVVTVYVIGQKPANDYTIQASIVEVNV